MKTSVSEWPNFFINSETRHSDNVGVPQMHVSSLVSNCSHLQRYCTAEHGKVNLDWVLGVVETNEQVNLKQGFNPSEGSHPLGPLREGIIWMESEMFQPLLWTDTPVLTSKSVTWHDGQQLFHGQVTQHFTCRGKGWLLGPLEPDQINRCFKLADQVFDHQHDWWPNPSSCCLWPKAFLLLFECVSGQRGRQGMFLWSTSVLFCPNKRNP